MKKTVMLLWMAQYEARRATHVVPGPETDRRGKLEPEEARERRTEERKARGYSRWAHSLDVLPGAKDPRRTWRNAPLMAHKDKEPAK